jgi:hypothetical protein
MYCITTQLYQVCFKPPQHCQLNWQPSTYIQFRVTLQHPGQSHGSAVHSLIAMRSSARGLPEGMLSANSTSAHTQVLLRTHS